LLIFSLPAPSAAAAAAGEPEGLLGEEGESDSEEEFDDDGEVDEEERQFERHVVTLPPIEHMEHEKEETRRARLVDFAVLAGDSSVSGEDDEHEEVDVEEEGGEGGEAADDKGGEQGGSAGDEGEEHEIDGVGFTVRHGTGATADAAGSGRRSVHSVIESLQSKVHQKATGYDASDKFIDDEELDNNLESNASLLEMRDKVPYSYDDFRISTDFEVAKEKRSGGGQQKKKPLKPLTELVPPPTEELRAAIDYFRETAKAHQETFEAQAKNKKVFNVPELLTGPLARLGRAIETWHPRKFLVEDIFEYVTDVLPANTQNLKNKAKKLIGRATPKEPAMSQGDDGGGGGGGPEPMDVDEVLAVAPPPPMPVKAARTPATPAAGMTPVSAGGPKRAPPVDPVKLEELKVWIC
jgi:hypothetical protein